MNNDLLNSNEFNDALADYFYLIDKNYPEKSSLKLVGDRYKLRTEQRVVLYRGICSSQKAQARHRRLTSKPEGLLVIDGYNVLFTLLNYRLGRFVFISNDNFCRDAGSLFGKIGKENLFTDCVSLLFSYLQSFEEIQVIIYLDAPVSFSQKHKLLLKDFLQKQNITGQVEVVPSADYSLKQHLSAIIATSDSALIDACTNPMIDLPRQIIETKYNTTLFNIQTKLNSILAH
jgi:hypothetical protein